MKVAIIGVGGHARVVYEILRHDRNIEVAAFVDYIKRDSGEKIFAVPLLGDHSVLPRLLREGVTGAIVAVGDNKIRAAHFEKLKNMGFKMVNAIHPTAHIAFDVKIGVGTVIATGAKIITGAKIGNNVIVNTGAIIEHACVLEDHCHIGPGAVLPGEVIVKKGAFIGAGSVLKQRITIGENATVGAGSVVLKDIPASTVAVGVPAKIIKMKNNSSLAS
jgi:sugar O-acyltransferase (sialic acid O-acetyltransferase NeuD family)